MKKLQITIDPDTFDSIVLEGLKDLRNLVQGDYENRKNGIGIAVFDLDPEKDTKQLEDLLTAFEQVIKYCSPPGELSDEYETE